MEISKKKIEELIEFMSLGCEYSGAEEVVNDTVSEILKELGSEITYGDELGITDGETEICTLDDFVRIFWEKSVELFLNVLSSEDETIEDMELSDKEIELLNGLNMIGFKYIARDENGDLYAYEPNYQNGYEREIRKGAVCWLNKGEGRFRLNGDLFKFIKWSDKEPYSIYELLKFIM